MELAVDYAVTYRDFLVSLHAYQKRSRWVRFVYCLDVWILPCLGVLVAAMYVYGLVTANASMRSIWQFPAIVGALAALGLPSLYQFKTRKVYRQRVALTSDGKVRAEVGDAGIRFVIPGRVDARYEWAAFNDYAEADNVLTLFVDKSAFHTLPKGDIEDALWTSLLQIVSQHVRRQR